MYMRSHQLLVLLCSKTRSQAVARIADRTAPQHLWGHVTSSVMRPFDTPYAISYRWFFGTKLDWADWL